MKGNLPMKTSQLIVLASVLLLSAACAPKSLSVPYDDRQVDANPISIEHPGWKETPLRSLPSQSSLRFVRARLFFRHKNGQDRVAADLSEDVNGGLASGYAARSGSPMAVDGMVTVFPAAFGEFGAQGRKFTVRIKGEQLQLEARDDAGLSESLESLIRAGGWEQFRLYEGPDHSYELRLLQKNELGGKGTLERAMLITYR
jgi:hypothetical protein